MDNDLRYKLRGEVMASWWEDLAAHQARGALLLARADLDLLDVAEAMARDESSRIEAWLKAGLLKRASTADKEAFEAISEGVRFQFIVVQPWVLAQQLTQP